ncbi:nuclear transport factor 2 family protein [Erythrobacter sp. MTPC3]|uniref:nuclear transport factor 2 family protein n=1 Tax=Erythrobacter sp. MTPC3 TaxID=3056564 RepID=UPI0036F1D5D6
MTSAKLFLEDRAQIMDVIAAYAHAVDRRRWNMMDALFHEDAQFQFGPVAGDWRGFVEQAKSILEPCLATHHQLGQTQFAFESADRCLTETYMTAMHTVPPGYPVAEVFPDKGVIYSAVIAGRYIDRFEKRGGRWAMTHRRGVYDWREFRVIEGTDLSELPAGSCGAHDASDPAVPVAARFAG